MSSEKIHTGNERAFIEQSMVHHRAFVGLSSAIHSSAENGEPGVGRAFVVHRAQARQAFVEHLMDRDRPLLPLLTGI